MLGSSSPSMEEGSQPDRLVLITLILLALFVLSSRKLDWSLILRANIALILLCLFAGLSIFWSPFPFLSLKRWFRVAGIIPIAAVVRTERSPLQAMESVLRRCAYVLIPLSLLLIKYYPHFGRAYGRWSGHEMWTGVALTKNALGHLCIVSALFLVWVLVRRRRNRVVSTCGFAGVADGLVLLIAGLMLLGIGIGVGERSATSIAVLMGSIVSMLFLFRLKNAARKGATLLMCGVVLTWMSLLFGESVGLAITPMLGRDQSFTGRTQMWDMCLKAAAEHPFWGAGYGGYFGTPGNEFFEEHGVVQGHNGLLDVYVELGIVGIILVVGFHLSLYSRFRRQFGRNFDWAVFAICLLVMSLLTNFSESVFLNSQGYIWNITILLSVVLSLPRLKEQAK